MVSSRASFFSMGIELMLSANDWGLDLCGSVLCEPPREVVWDSLAMSVSSCNYVPIARGRDNNSSDNVHEWPLILRSTHAQGEELELGSPLSC